LSAKLIADKQALFFITTHVKQNAAEAYMNGGVLLVRPA